MSDEVVQLVREDREFDSSETNEADNKNHGVYFVPGLHRGLLVLEALAEAQKPMSISDIARALGITRSAAFRLVYTLRYTGFVESEPDSKKVRLGGRVLSLGFSYLAGMSIIETAQPDLDLLRDATGITSHIGIRDGRDLLYLACAHSRSGFVSTINVGSRFPVHLTPMGWLLLSDLAPRKIGELFPDQQPYKALTEYSPTTLEALLDRVMRAGAQGYIVSRGILEPGGSSICAPVLNAQNKVVAAIDISGPDIGFDEARMDQYLSEVRAAAQRISIRLGYTPARRSDDLG
ncbi:IclR family transcriptional regulator [Hyphomicrobiales bacterium]|nr:IclR family transcriptional regulator [Hyphomicrobiales bacterium]CAH1666878.1 IclR family transcriptional regulator [Hyphomicrobiales bacterium]